MMQEWENLSASSSSLDDAAAFVMVLQINFLSSQSVLLLLYSLKEKKTVVNKYIIWSFVRIEVDVPEWLSGMTRNHVGFARAGSNPAVHGSF